MDIGYDLYCGDNNTYGEVNYRTTVLGSCSTRYDEKTLSYDGLEPVVAEACAEELMANQ